MSAGEADFFLSGAIHVEEKVDGTCLGFSVTGDGRIRAHTRGQYLTGDESRQFRPLNKWMEARKQGLLSELGLNLVLYGEWCYARHTVTYDGLPDWFLAFDVFDRMAGRFWSIDRRNALTNRLRIVPVPLLAVGHFNKMNLQSLMARSRLGSEMVEGLYLRAEEGEWLRARAKLVRTAWLATGTTHWSKRHLERNQLLQPDNPHAVR